MVAEVSKYIIDENKIYFDDTNFEKLVKLRKNSIAYLKAMGSDELDDRFKNLSN